MREFPSTICLLEHGRWAQILKEFEDIINDPSSTEHDVQEFFQRQPDLLKGDQYDRVIPQPTLVVSDENLSTEWRADFVLDPIDPADYPKLLELKTPHMNLAKMTPSGHVQFYRRLWDAIQQVRDYARQLQSADVRAKFRDKYGIDMVAPDLHIIAGRKWDLELTGALRAARRSVVGVQIEDYETVLRRLRRQFT